MGKKNKNKQRAVQDSATCSRINFLHQAAGLVPLPLQRHYLTTAKTAQKKTMLKLDPKMKRLTCRRCAALLTPGTGNAATRLMGGSGDEMVEVRCVHCGCVKRVKIVEGCTVWSEKEPVEIAQLHP
jgi:RNase P subunit RPR2